MHNTLRQFLEIAHIHSPSFSPDNSTIAFLSDASGVSQLFTVPVAGRTDPQPLTSFAEPIQTAAYSPTRSEIAFTMARGGDERAQLFIVDTDTRMVRQLTEQNDVIHHWGGWSPDGEWITYASNARNGIDFDVYVMHVVSGKTRRVFARGGWCDSLGFSSTGRYVVVREQQTFHGHNLFLVDLNGGDAAVLVTPHTGTAEYAEPCWLPGDEQLLFVSSTDRECTAVEHYTVDSRQHRTLFAPEWDVMHLRLSPEGRTLACVVNEAGYLRLVLVDAATGRRIEEPTLPLHVVSSVSWSRDGAHLAGVVEQNTEPTNIVVWSAQTFEQWPLTHNAVQLPAHLFVEPTVTTYQSFDQREIPMMIFTPSVVPEDRPAIVFVHGGPESQFREGFHPLVQYFVSRGYTVIAPNIRGSRGYGKTFLGLDDRELRMDSIRDLESLYHTVVAQKIAHPQRIALIGGSYGGYMTLAGLAFQPKLWAAGVSRFGMSSLVTFLENTAPWRRRIREWEYGSLEHDRALLESLSPMTHIDDVRAPLMVIHGANDPRIPLAEAEQVVSSLQARGRIAELLLYPDEGHGFGKLVNKLHAYERVSDFLDKHLRGVERLD